MVMAQAQKEIELRHVMPAQWKMEFTSRGLKLIAPSAREADLFHGGAKTYLTSIAQRIGNIEIMWDGCKETLKIKGSRRPTAAIENQFETIPEQLRQEVASLIGEGKPRKLLYVAQLCATPALVLAMSDLINDPRKAGISRASDGRQLVMSDACSILNPGHTLDEAVNWCRRDFWHPADLLDLHTKLRDLPLVEASGSSLNFSSLPFIEHRWTSFDPDLGINNKDEGNWLKFRTRYRHFQGEDGVLYQLCENLDFREINPPAIAYQ
jgi:hypothetical protein